MNDLSYLELIQLNLCSIRRTLFVEIDYGIKSSLLLIDTFEVYHFLFYDSCLLMITRKLFFPLDYLFAYFCNGNKRSFSTCFLFLDDHEMICS